MNISNAMIKLSHILKIGSIIICNLQSPKGFSAHTFLLFHGRRPCATRRSKTSKISLCFLTFCRKIEKNDDSAFSHARCFGRYEITVLPNKNLDLSPKIFSCRILAALIGRISKRCHV